MKKYDVFDGDVSDGALQAPADIDLLIVFLLEKLGGMTKAQILNAVSASGSANYLEAAQCVSNLIERGALHAEGDGEYAPLRITQNGRAALAVLGDNLPRSVGDKALRAALRAQTRLRNLEANAAEIEKTPDGCFLRLSVKEQDDILFSLRLYVAEELHAQSMRDRFLTEPSALLDAITAALL